MKLLTLRAHRYGSLRNQRIALDSLNLSVEVNASGKTFTAFPERGYVTHDFREPKVAETEFGHL